MKDLRNQFRSFYTEQEAIDVCELLLLNGIQAIIKNSLERKDVPNLIQIGHINYEILIHPEDLSKAELILQANQVVEEPKDDYYLNQFNNEDLLNVLIDTRDWSELDVQLAEKILIERGEIIDQHLIEIERTKRIDALRTFDKMPVFQIAFGYIFGFAFAPVAIMIGYSIYVDRKKLPDGTEMFRYNNFDRANGIAIIVISSVMIAFYFYYFFS